MMFGVSVVGFLLMKLPPGDPSGFLLGPNAGPEARRRLLESLGWDLPWPVQYVRWLDNLFHGDFGTSVRSSEPVLTVFARSLTGSLALIGVGFAFALLVGFSLGIVAATRKFSLLDRVLSVGAIALASAPVYWLGLVLVAVFSLTLRWLPVSGMQTVGRQGDMIDFVRHLILPAFTVSLVPMAVLFRLTRSEMSTILEQPYVQAARARGIPERDVVLRHATRALVAPLANLSGLQLGFLFTATLFTEVVFAWPGIGYMIFQAIAARDIPALQIVVLFVGGVFVTVNLLSDVVQAIVDPRSRMAET
jgi:peptide/nickel transport system permease protein